MLFDSCRREMVVRLCHSSYMSHTRRTYSLFFPSRYREMTHFMEMLSWEQPNTSILLARHFSVEKTVQNIWLWDWYLCSISCKPKQNIYHPYTCYIKYILVFKKSSLKKMCHSIPKKEHTLREYMLSIISLSAFY